MLYGDGAVTADASGVSALHPPPALMVRLRLPGSASILRRAQRGRGAVKRLSLCVTTASGNLILLAEG